MSIIEKFLPEAAHCSQAARDFVDQILARMDPDEALTALRYAQVEDQLRYAQLDAALSSYRS